MKLGHTDKILPLLETYSCGLALAPRRTWSALEQGSTEARHSVLPRPSMDLTLDSEEIVKKTVNKSQLYRGDSSLADNVMTQVSI